MFINKPPILAYPRPSVLKSYDPRAIASDGNWAISTDVSRVIVHNRVACMYASASNSPSLKNFKRFIDAKLHAVSSKNMYSEQGLEPRICPSSGQVCQALIVS